METRSKRRFALAGATGLVLASLGAANARALEAPPLPTVPTVTAPSLTEPLPIAPPPLPPPPSVPALPAPPEPEVAVPPPPTLVSPSAPADLTSTSSPLAPARSSTPGETASESSSARTTSTPASRRPSISDAQAARTRAHPRAATIRFRLTRATRVVVVLRGPLPDCAEAGRFALRGRPGVNEFPFRGRVANRRLAVGTYLLGLQPKGATRTQWVAVRVREREVAPLSAALAARSVAGCDVRSGDRAGGFLGALGAADGGPPPRPRSTPGGAPDASAPPTASDAPGLAPADPPFPNVLGVSSDESRELLATVVALAVILLLIGSAAGIVAYVVRFLRTPTA